MAALFGDIIRSFSHWQIRNICFLCRSGAFIILRLTDAPIRAARQGGGRHCARRIRTAALCDERESRQLLGGTIPWYDWGPCLYRNYVLWNDRLLHDNCRPIVRKKSAFLHGQIQLRNWRQHPIRFWVENFDAINIVDSALHRRGENLSWFFLLFFVTAINFEVT